MDVSPLVTTGHASAAARRETRVEGVEGRLFSGRVSPRVGVLQSVEIREISEAAQDKGGPFAVNILVVPAGRFLLEARGSCCLPFRWIKDAVQISRLLPLLPEGGFQLFLR